VNDTLQIEWSLGNSCNLKCSYCSWELNDGTNPFPDIDKLSLAFAHIVEQSQAFSNVKIDINGGEPTLSLALQHVIFSNQDPRIKFRLMSNGQASVAQWTQMSPNLYDLTLTYHSTEDLNHFSRVIDAVRKHVEPTVCIAFTPDNWINQRQVYNILKEQGVKVQMQLLYNNFTKGNNAYLAYSNEQWNEYYTEQGIDIYNTQQVASTIEFKRVNLLNNYFGHLCWAGVTQIVIDNFGNVWRGWCKSNKSMGNIFLQTLILNATPTACTKTQCKNGFDLQARKSEGTWGIA
jgi:sulfatase maturation enzyme AslB (radical SAM superfamily)